MVCVDTNILVYAHRADLPAHREAMKVLATLAQSKDRWAIAWPCVHEFVSTVTKASVFKVPSPWSAVERQLDAWFESPTLTLIQESARHWTTLRQLIHGIERIGPRVHDARIAAICLDADVRELWTADRDFSIFPALRVVNPLNKV